MKWKGFTRIELLVVIAIIATLAAILLPALAEGQNLPVASAKSNPIHINFVIHFDPLPTSDGQVLREGYEAQRDNLQWLADYLERLEKEKGKEFVPRLTLEMAGDHAEWYLEDDKGLDLLRRLYQKGIHSFGTHFHVNYKVDKHRWDDASYEGLPQDRQRVTQDHVAEVDKLIGKIIGSDDPKAIRRVNRTITGHLVDHGLAERMGYDTLTGGAENEVMNVFFDHDVYNPWRLGTGWELAEDLSGHWLLVPQAPMLGWIGEHAPIPPGVPEEYRRGMQSMIWQDISVPAMKRKFLHLYLEWRQSAIRNPQSAIEKVWVFGWHEHTHDIFPDEAQKVAGNVRRKLRGTVVEYVEWLNANFIGQKTADGDLVATYSNTDEVRDEFLAWEKTHPGQSSFNYPVRTRDWEKYPYQMKGLARELIYAHYEKEIATFKDKGVHVHKLVKTDGRNWALLDGKMVCTGTTKDVYLLWSDKDGVTIDFSDVAKGQVRLVEGKSGKESILAANNLAVSADPVVVEPVGE